MVWVAWIEELLLPLVFYEQFYQSISDTVEYILSWFPIPFIKSTGFFFFKKKLSSIISSMQLSNLWMVKPWKGMNTSLVTTVTKGPLFNIE